MYSISGMLCTWNDCKWKIIKEYKIYYFSLLTDVLKSVWLDTWFKSSYEL